jgi:hypothetical protein
MLDPHKFGRNSADDPKGSVMSDFAAALKDGVSAWQQKREPTKLECGLLGALLASIVLAFFFWLGIQLSMLSLVIL